MCRRGLRECRDRGCPDAGAGGAGHRDRALPCSEEHHLLVDDDDPAVTVVGSDDGARRGVGLSGLFDQGPTVGGRVGAGLGDVAVQPDSYDAALPEVGEDRPR